MSNINPEEIISVLKSEIEDYDVKTEIQETGTVVSVGDGIANVYGINHAMYGEIVEFENGVRGLVQNIEMKTIGVVLLGSDRELTEGSKVVRTGKKAGIGVSDAMLGRVVNALGAPIDGKGSIPADEYRPIENPAPSVIDRKSVSVPLETGILAIDAMFPIGRGQRELIIGDRQTGKTSIAIDTILNQKGKDVICIYVAIGQKESTVARVVQKLEEAGAEIIEYDDAVRVTRFKPLTKCNVKTMPHPGFPTDMQPQIAVTLALANGTSIVTESIFENRFRYVDELTKMGATIQVDGRTAIISGVEGFTGADVHAPDLRAGAALVIAGLSAKGFTTVSDIGYIYRGYEQFEQKLKQLGGEIQLVNNEKEVTKFKLKIG